MTFKDFKRSCTGSPLAQNATALHRNLSILDNRVVALVCLCLSVSLCLSSLPLSLSLSLSLPLSLSLSHTHTRARAHTHTHILSLSLSLSDALTLCSTAGEPAAVRSRRVGTDARGEQLVQLVCAKPSVTM